MKTIKYKRILISSVVFFASCISMFLVISKANTQSNLKAIPNTPKGGTSVSRQTPDVTSSELPQAARYHHLLILYLRTVDAVVQQQKQDARASYDRRLADRQKIFQDINDHEKDKLQLLETAADQRQNKQLDFDGEVPETALTLMDSPASGRIFTTLCRENKVNELMLVATARYTSLLPSSPTMSPEWVALVKDIDRRHPGNVILHNIVAKLLYAAGIDTKALRPQLIQLAHKSSDYDALNLLFFTYDINTGASSPQVTLENITLLKQFAALPTLDPEMQETCAEYAVAIHDYDRAQAICTRLLMQRYKAFNNPQKKDDIPSDDALGRARERALYLMFYNIHNERMFQIIYNLSVIVQVQVQNASTNKTSASIIFDDDIPAENLDITAAKSYIDQVSAWKG